mmetsp:Transcript_47516/g.112967  ORF Transcript_47516/g.112967 Transcript_47516/m.112967 type:complete len:374 (+) Transcript_47516:537-1658(+)
MTDAVWHHQLAHHLLECRRFRWWRCLPLPRHFVHSRSHRTPPRLLTELLLQPTSQLGSRGFLLLYWKSLQGCDCCLPVALGSLQLPLDAMTLLGQGRFRNPMGFLAAAMESSTPAASPRARILATHAVQVLPHHPPSHHLTPHPCRSHQPQRPHLRQIQSLRPHRQGLAQIQQRVSGIRPRQCRCPCHHLQTGPCPHCHLCGPPYSPPPHLLSMEHVLHLQAAETLPLEGYVHAQPPLRNLLQRCHHVQQQRLPCPQPQILALDMERAPLLQDVEQPCAERVLAHDTLLHLHPYPQVHPPPVHVLLPATAHQRHRNPQSARLHPDSLYREAAQHRRCDSSPLLQRGDSRRFLLLPPCSPARQHAPQHLCFGTA